MAHGNPVQAERPPIDLSIPVPMQAGLPALARPNDFVQVPILFKILDEAY